MEKKRLTRSSNDRMLAGVAAGIAEYLDTDPTLIRLLFVLLALAGGNGLLIYLIMWLVMPEETAAA
jgi:phage shock protein PspC (stress-responsive transcriptional regulator)